MKTPGLALIVWILSLVSSLSAAEFHVSIKGDDSNAGSRREPLRTISAAALRAQPGDIITVHAGIYRECIDPPRGGTSDRKRIVYHAAPGETVEIKGSEMVTNWVKGEGAVWKVTLPNTFFGAFNPYKDVIHGDWFFTKKGREDHTGAVYLNGRWMVEAGSRDEVMQPTGKTPLWFGEVGNETTSIWGQFPGVNPNEQQAEINVRQTVFFPSLTNINYITVRGFTMRHAAAPWAPPTAKQIGLIGTHWSKGWIIESNVISHSTCSGIALGKYGDEWDNKSATAEGYVKTIERATANGWSKERIGHHIVRYNCISDCEQAGIVGSLGAVFSTIEGNAIHDIHVRRLFGGAEMAGIKIHGAIDVEIRNNHIYHTIRGIWLDWMAQGTRVSANLLHDNAAQDVFLEVDHGPFLFDNNILLSPTSVGIQSQGGAFVHNLFTGTIHLSSADKRMTPFHKAHSTIVAGFHDNPHGDIRFYNNLFVQRADLSGYDAVPLPVWMDGNVFLQGAIPCTRENAPFVEKDFDAALQLSEIAGAWSLALTVDKDCTLNRKRPLVTTRLLGKAMIPCARFEKPDGKPLCIDQDYFGAKRTGNPFPGPFQMKGAGKPWFVLWPRLRAY